MIHRRVLLAAVLMMIGCGGGAPDMSPRTKPQGTTVEKGSAPTVGDEVPSNPTIESTSAGTVSPPPTSQTTASTPSVPSTAGLNDAQIGAAQTSFDQSSATFVGASGNCSQMCKALASMTRAADALCALTTGAAPPDQARCDRARKKVTEASNTVKATCGGCE